MTYEKYTHANIVMKIYMVYTCIYILEKFIYMQTAVKQWGNSLGVRLNKQIAAKLNITSGTIVNLEIEEKTNSIIIKPHKTKLSVLLSKITGDNKHEEVFNVDDNVGDEQW